MVNLSNLLPPDFVINTSEQRPIYYSDDVLALYCQTKGITPNLNAQASDEFHVEANDIRKYYNRKLLMRGFTQPLTNYQKALLNIINREDKKVIFNGEEGIFYKVREFYQQDLMLDTLFVNAEKTFNRDPKDETGTWILNYQGTIPKSNRSVKANEYWFIDNDNRLTSISINLPNPLDKLWQEKLNKDKILTIKGNRKHTTLYNRNYYRMFKWEIINA